MSTKDRLILGAGVICGVLFFITWQWYWGAICFVLLVVIVPWPGLDDGHGG
jgi:hypothetical protein